MSQRLLLTVSGWLEVSVGVLTLLSPVTALAFLLGGPEEPIASGMTRLFGAGVFSLGLACLKARDDVGSPAGFAVSMGVTAYNLLAAVIIAWIAARSGLGTPLLWAAGIGHAVLGGLFVSALVRSGR
ncbi:MAG: hypothetical protein ACXW34_07025 [Nitrospira sp.]